MVAPAAPRPALIAQRENGDFQSPFQAGVHCLLQALVPGLGQNLEESLGGGAEPALEFLSRVGVKIVQKPADWDPGPTDVLVRRLIDEMNG